MQKLGRDAVSRLFGLKRPCANCPFRSDGEAIELAPGRLIEIARGLLRDDQRPFFCHKTLSGKHEEEAFGDGAYTPGPDDRYCAGAMILLEKAGRPNVAMRLGRVIGVYDADALRSATREVIDPPEEDDR